LNIPRIAAKGEIWFLVDLAQVFSHTLEQIEDIALALRYTPQLRIAEYQREGKRVLEPVLLIHQGTLPESALTLNFEEAVPEILLEHWEQLAATLQPTTAVHLRVGLQ
jgi:hypothetical protein